MLPILYPSNTSKQGFNKNGLGFIKDCLSCVVSETRNGAYECELKALKTDRLSNLMIPSNFVKVRANGYDPPQIFEIYQVSGDTETITAKAQHLKYIACGNATSETLPINSPDTPQNMWDNHIAEYLTLSNDFEFYSNITSTGIVTAAKERPTRLGDILQGVKGSMLDVFGGEFHYDNFKIELLNRRGTDTSIAIRWGSQVSDIVQEADSTTVYSYLLPFAKVKIETSVTRTGKGEYMIYGNLLDLDCSRLTYKRVLTYDFTDEFTDDVLTVDENNYIPDSGEYTALFQKLNALANKYKDNNESALKETSVNITVDLADTLKTLQNCKLCDTVLVRLGEVNTRAKIVKTVYDCLREEYIKIELGTIKKTIADLFSGKNIGGA